LYSKCTLVKVQTEQEAVEDPGFDLAAEYIVLLVILVVPCLIIFVITFCVCLCFGSASLATYAQFFGYNIMNSQSEWLGKKTLSFPYGRE
jgi:hypothetical protein